MPIIRNYSEANDYLARGRNKDDRPLTSTGVGWNGQPYNRRFKATRVVRRAGYGGFEYIDVTLYGSPIITYRNNPTGRESFTINAGYDSKMTRDRISMIAGVTCSIHRPTYTPRCQVYQSETGRHSGFVMADGTVWFRRGSEATGHSRNGTKILHEKRETTRYWNTINTEKQTFWLMKSRDTFSGVGNIDRMSLKELGQRLERRFKGEMDDVAAVCQKTRDKSLKIRRDTLRLRRELSNIKQELNKRRLRVHVLEMEAHKEERKLRQRANALERAEARLITKEKDLDEREAILKGDEIKFAQETVGRSMDGVKRVSRV